MQLRRLIIALLVAIALAAAGWSWAAHWRPDPADYPLQGIDLALDDPPPSWPHVRAAGADFAYIAATGGAQRRNSRLGTLLAGAYSAGLRAGVVHVWSLCDPPAAQATNFLATVPRLRDALPAAVAVGYDDACPTRPSPARLVADLDAFLAAAEAHTGTPLLIRVSRAVEGDYALTAALDRPIWVIGNFRAPGYPARPWVMWRANAMRRIEGIDGPINWNVVKP